MLENRCDIFKQRLKNFNPKSESPYFVTKFLLHKLLKYYVRDHDLKLRDNLQKIVTASDI